MTKKEFNNWLQDCKIDKDSKYTSLLSTDCLYNFYKEAQKEQLRLYGVGKSETKLICECEDGTFVWDYEKEDWTNCISCGLPDE